MAERVCDHSVARKARAVPAIAVLLSSLLVALGVDFAGADAVRNSVSNSAGAVVTVASGGSAQVGFFIQVQGPDPENGCNATQSSPATVRIAVAGATATPSSLTFSDCGRTQTVAFTSTTAGDHPVTVSVSDGGPGTYDPAPAAFTLRVQAPADSTPPVLTPTVTGTKGLNGWYTSDVAVSWAVSDAESAATVDSGCAPASVPDAFTTEGTAFTSSCTAHSAGGTSSDSVAVKIDKSGPTASLSASGLLGQNGWFTGDVTIAANGADGISGPVTCTADQHQTAETRGSVFNGSCTNQAGLATGASPLTVKLDKSGPTADVAVTAGRLGSNGWYTSDVTVAVQGTDSISGPVACSPGQTLTTDTAGADVSGRCTNDAGLSTDATPRTIRIDKSNPTAYLQVASGATLGSGGWYTTGVTVQTKGADNVSEPLDCTADQLFESDTPETVVNGSCTNRAGLRQEADALTLGIDTTPPVSVSLSIVSGTAGANGWYTSAVTVRATGEDVTSGVSCTADQVFGAETEEITVNGSCTNGAGMTTEAAPLTIRIDTTAPSASLAVTGGTEGVNGWYTSDVTVSATGEDTVSGPVTCTADQHQTAETTGRVFNGSCTNRAGLTANAAALTVKLDETGPVATLAATGARGENGWFTGDVTVTTSGSDSISDPVACDAVRYQGDETPGTEFAGSCINAAGLPTDAAPIVVKLDRTGPSAGLSPAGTAGQNSWFVGDVTVTTAGTDTVSGPVTCTAVQHQTAETAGTDFHGSCTNQAGLSTAATVLRVKLDKTAPTGVVLTPTGTAGANGWFTGDVTVATTGSEDVSTPLACDAPQTLTTDTTGTGVRGSCTNDAGLTTNGAEVTVRIDTTDPDAHLQIVSGDTLGTDWYVSDVTVRTVGSDNVSEPVSCTGDQHLTSDTPGTAVSGSCTNDAGRRQATEPITVKIDKTPPADVALSVVSGTPGANGWYTSSVSVRTTGQDVTTGVACTADQELISDTAGIRVTGSCTNGAGLVTAAAPLTVKIDTTAPSALLSVVAGDRGDNNWYVSNVTVRTSGDDPTSGVTCTVDQSQTTETRSATFTGTCVNGAGLSADATQLVVKLDKTGPTAALAVTMGTPGQGGWYVSDVTVSTSGSDTVSAPVSCTGDQRQWTNTDGAGQVFAGSCTNDAGLSTSAAPLTVMLDESAPTVSVTGVSDGAAYVLDSVPPSGCSTSDPEPGSGVQAQASVSTSGGTVNNVGTYTTTCSGAQDHAGNLARPITATFGVLYGSGSGILQPINADNSSIFSRGRAVPVKLRLPGDEGAGGFNTSGWRFERLQISCAAFDTAIGALEDVPSVTPSSLFRYDGSADQYVNNADFRDKAAGTCWKIRVTLDDGTALYSAVFKLQK